MPYAGDDGKDGPDYDLDDAHACLAAELGLPVQRRNTHETIALVYAARDRLHALSAPIAMELFCPMCWQRHVDVDEFATKVHHTHSCQHCGHSWRPAVVATVGVAFLPGFRNAGDPPVEPETQALARQRLGSALLAKQRAGVRVVDLNDPEIARLLREAVGVGGESFDR